VEERSNLPGPRANLELAEAFAEAVARIESDRSAQVWELCSKLAGLQRDGSAQNAPGEFVVFCGVRGQGALGTASAKFFGRAMKALKEHAGDDRWRVRESVAASLQKLLVASPREVLSELDGWVDGDHWLEMRAVAAGIAEPALMKNPQLADAGVSLHKKVLDLVLRGDGRRSASFKALRQALGYSISVVAVARPAESFALMKGLVRSGDADALWIVNENLKKDRVRRGFPKEASELGALAQRAVAKARA